VTDKPVNEVSERKEDETAVPEVAEQPVDTEQTLEEQLEKAQAEAAEYLDGWQRARAELANYRKRTERERAQWRSVIRGEVIIELLDILDDFDRAMENLPGDTADHDWVSGVALIYRKLKSKLDELGVAEIEAEGETFDPELHEAVMQLDDPDHEAGQVIEVLRKGYRLDDRVLRPSMVVVAS
jgi:molecular chaperone GrpE